MYFYFRLFEKSVFYSKRIFNDPFKIYRPDLFELIYMMMSIMWNIKGMLFTVLHVLYRFDWNKRK